MPLCVIDLSQVVHVSAISLERMVSAVEMVRWRLLLACSTLDSADIKYAVAGYYAVAAWVSAVDEAAVRNARDVDLMITRADLDVVKLAFDSAGFYYRHMDDLDHFLNTPNASV